jgi:hypothetical protein
MPPLLVPPVEEMTLTGMRPVDARFGDLPRKDRKAARAMVKQCCTKAQSIRRDAEKQYQL